MATGTCYAKALGGCDAISLEHPISECVLDLVNVDDKGIVVTGMPWLKGQQKTLRPSTLGASVLCRKHNSALSPVDTAGKSVVTALVESIRKADEGAGILFTEPFRGYDLERWLLKALCGYVAAGAATRSDLTPIMTAPAAEWVDVLFGEKAWPKAWGLLVPRAPRGRFFVDGARLKFTPLSIGNDIVGAQYSIQGVDLIIDVTGRIRNGEYTPHFPHVYRPWQIAFSRRGCTGQRGIDLIWGGFETGTPDASVIYELDGPRRQVGAAT